jgi:hypothetical protein
LKETKDRHVKLQLADKISPLLIGAYKESEKSVKQYLEEIFAKLSDKKEDAIEIFSEKFLSHGYPIEKELLKCNGINVCEPDSQIESTIYDLYEIITDLAFELYSNHEESGWELLLLQTTDGQTVIFDKHDITSELEDSPQKIIDSTDIAKKEKNESDAVKQELKP